MKLRSKLFLSTTALLTVALLGLMLGIFSVLQLTQSQNRTLAHNLNVISDSLDLRQELGKQLFLVLGERSMSRRCRRYAPPTRTSDNG